MEKIGMHKHTIHCSPVDVAMEWDGEQVNDVTLSLHAIEVCNSLSRSLYLDGEGVKGCNNINWTDKDVVARDSWVKFPDCRGSFDCSNVGNDWHDIGDGNIQHMSKAGKTMGGGVEWVDVAVAQDGFYIVTHGIVVGHIVGSDAEELWSGLCQDAEAIKWVDKVTTEIFVELWTWGQSQSSDLLLPWRKPSFDWLTKDQL